MRRLLASTAVLAGAAGCVSASSSITFTAPPEPSNPGISFNDTFGSYMVLQREPGTACLYGSLGDGGTGARVKVKDEIGTCRLIVPLGPVLKGSSFEVGFTRK